MHSGAIGVTDGPFEARSERIVKGMEFDVVPLVDGDVVLVASDDSPGEEAGTTGAETPSEHHAVTEHETGLLDASEVAQILGEAIASGLTFEALKALAQRVAARRHTPPASADIEQVRQAVVDYLAGSGYSTVTVTETQQLAGQGWSLEGRADARRFTALVEVSGQVVHVRVR